MALANDTLKSTYNVQEKKKTCEALVSLSFRVLCTQKRLSRTHLQMAQGTSWKRQQTIFRSQIAKRTVGK